MGHWDGETLVIDVTNFNDKTWLDSPATPIATNCTWSSATRAPARTPSPTRPRSKTPNVLAALENRRMPLHRITEQGFELQEQECMEGDSGRAIHPHYRPAPKY